MGLLFLIKRENTSSRERSSERRVLYLAAGSGLLRLLRIVLALAAEGVGR